MVSVVKMARSALPKNSVMLYVSCGEKELNVKNIHEEMFPVYRGKCSLRKACSHLDGKHSADDGEVETEMRKWLRKQKTSVLRVSTH
jgi:hypothetical protein